MTPLEVIEGLVVLAVVLGSVSVASVRLTARYLPGWSGPPARLAQAVAGVAFVILLGQALGSLGLFRPWPVAGACTAFGVGVWRWLGRAPAQQVDRAAGRRPRRRRGDPVLEVVSGAMAAVIVLQWAHRVLLVARQGLSDVDSQIYHGPFAVHFVQEGWVTRLHFVSGGSRYYPANGELFQGLAMLPFHRDVFLPFVNLGWLGLALLAAWCVGRPFGVAPLTLGGMAVVCSTPLLVDFNAGTAGNDIIVLALVVAAVALIVNSGWRPPALALAGAAAGLAVGTKLTAIAPVAGLTVGLPWVIPAELRRSRTALWLASVMAFGSFWYLRNLVRVGNPVAFTSVSIGPLSLPAGSSDRAAEELGVPLVIYAWSPANWGELLAGASHGLGPSWPAVVGLAGAGVVASILSRERPLRWLGLVGAVATVAYLLTPNSAGGIGGGFFQVNLRYVTPALAVGLVLLPFVRPFAPARRLRYLLATFAVIIVTNQAATGLYATWPDDRRVFAAVVAAAVLATVWFGAVRWRHQRRLVSSVTVAFGVVALIVGAGWTRMDMGTPALAAVEQWAQDIRQQRIAVVADSVYYLYGSDLSNRLEAPTAEADQGSATPIRNCRDWRQALDRGKYQYAVIRPGIFGFFERPEVEWTRTAPGATEVPIGGSAAVFRLPEEVTTEGCSSPGT